MASSHHKLGLGLPLVAMVAMGCGEDPSFRLRWNIETQFDQPFAATPDEPGVQNPSECTRTGIITVEVTAWDELGSMADQRTYPCYPSEFFRPEGTAAGPTLDPGSYELVVRGVRRDGIGWFGPAADLDQDDDGFLIDRTPRCEDSECELDFLACDCTQIEVKADRTLTIDDLVLDAPPQCEDGIDNDRDGLVDSVDPGCRQSDSEFNESNTVQFLLQVGFLGNNPNASCIGVNNVTQFVISLDGEELLTTQCRLDPFFFTAEVEQGAHRLSVVTLGPGVPFENGPMPRTREKEIDFNVSGQGAFVEVAVDFGDADFLEPIVDEALVPLSFESVPGRATRTCQSNDGTLVIDSVRVTVLDARGNPLPDPVLDDEGMPLDGTPRPCPTGFLHTQKLTWGGYTVNIEALSAEGEVCFATPAGAPQPLAPGEPNFRIQRPQGPVPASCRECEPGNGDCVHGQCEDGVCVP